MSKQASRQTPAIMSGFFSHRSLEAIPHERSIRRKTRMDSQKFHMCHEVSIYSFWRFVPTDRATRNIWGRFTKTMVRCPPRFRREESHDFLDSLVDYLKLRASAFIPPADPLRNCWL